MLVRKYLIPLMSVAGIALAVHTVRSEGQTRPAPDPVAPPPKSPYRASVAGSGIIEASTENIAIGTNVPGIVTQVFVKAGDHVKKGDPLFRLDDRTLNAELHVRQTNLAVLKQQLKRDESSPRPEDIPPAEARVAEAQSMLDDAVRQYEMMQNVSDKRAIVEETLSKRKYAVDAARARLAEAQAQLKLLQAGTWQPALEITRAQVQAADAQVKATETEIERLTVRAPVDGDILQHNIRAGEYAQTGFMDKPLMILGDTGTLHVRVDVDENDAWRVASGAKARASLRGNATLGTDLTFVRIEPYVVPKKSLTGESSERVDTRVLQVLYAFPRASLNAYVGQLVDVHIEAPSQPSGK